MKHVTIPRHWSAEQALSVVRFLDDVIRAVWRQHGEEMAACMEYLRAPPSEMTDPPSNEVDVPF